MKIQLLVFLNFLFHFTFSNAQPTQIVTKPKIDFIVTNDYMSERNLSFMGGPIPVNYKKEITDSLRNSYVELYDNNDNIIQEKFYNSVGALYQTNQKNYDSKNRLEKTVEIDEFTNDTCIINHKYTDSLDLATHKKVSSSCNEDFLDFYYKYNPKGEKTEELMNENKALFRKKFIQDISKKERRVKSYDSANRLSTYVYNYNDKGLLFFEKSKTWDYVIKGEYFEIEEENEYLYKYDKNGNWTERTKQTHCPMIKPVEVKIKKTSNKKQAKIIPPQTENNYCNPEIKEKLIRKIYYK